MTGQARIFGYSLSFPADSFRSSSPRRLSFATVWCSLSPSFPFAILAFTACIIFFWTLLLTPSSVSASPSLLLTLFSRPPFRLFWSKCSIVGHFFLPFACNTHTASLFPSCAELFDKTRRREEESKCKDMCVCVNVFVCVSRRLATVESRYSFTSRWESLSASLLVFHDDSCINDDPCDAEMEEREKNLSSNTIWGQHSTRSQTQTVLSSSPTTIFSSGARCVAVSTPKRLAQAFRMTHRSSSGEVENKRSTKKKCLWGKGRSRDQSFSCISRFFFVENEVLVKQL